MSITPGKRFGLYEITAQIGEGGMVLPPALGADHDRLARFQREAEVLASLNHPHIAAIYGVEESEGTTALVMELVDGEDLSHRIAGGAIPIALTSTESGPARDLCGVVYPGRSD